MANQKLEKQEGREGGRKRCSKNLLQPLVGNAAIDDTRTDTDGIFKEPVAADWPQDAAWARTAVIIILQLILFSKDHIVGLVRVRPTTTKKTKKFHRLRQIM